jgi:hypothetical protein
MAMSQLRKSVEHMAGEQLVMTSSVCGAMVLIG